MICSECTKISDFASYGTFVVHGKLETPPVPGWIIVAPARHVTQIDDLTSEERAELGVLVGRVAETLRRVTSCTKIYVCVFAELLEHLHVHIVARPEGLDVQWRGPAIFSAPPGDEGAFRDVTRRVLGAL